MNRYVKTALLAGAAWSALSTFALAQDAVPQDGASSLDDVVVSARRRAVDPCSAAYFGLNFQSKAVA